MSKHRTLLSRLLQFRGFGLALMAMYPSQAGSQDMSSNVVIQWNNAALQAVRDSKIGPPMVARALAIVHTCMYDAWTAYDDRALGTQLGSSLRQSPQERNQANREKAISFAAYRAAADLFPSDTAQIFDPLMVSLGYDRNDTSTDTTTPSGVGNVACAAVLSFRHNDGSNQLGTLTPSGVPYADYTGYEPVNPPSTVPVDPATVVNINRWQPLQYVDSSSTFVTQTFVGPFWNQVVPFALSSADQFRQLIAAAGPMVFGSAAFIGQAAELITMSANLSDEQKMITEYWADGPHTELPPGHWDLFAQFVSNRDHHQLGTDVKMFFALTNAIFDASIVAWDAKRTFDSVRPVTAIPFLFHGRQIRAWGGPYAGTQVVDGGRWIPYQASTFPTPPFPEFISGHSTFSAAGAEVLSLFTGSDYFGDSVTFAAGSSQIEPGATPAQPVTLSWRSFFDAANQAGISRRYGGIHFEAADLTGRVVGRLIGRQALAKARSLWRGTGSEDSSHQEDQSEE
jgi:membrane-associated phospholipid phosphatase